MIRIGENMRKIIILGSICLLYIILIIFIPIIAKANVRKVEENYRIFLYLEELDNDSIKSIVNHSSSAEWRAYTIYNNESKNIYEKYDNLNINVYCIIESYEDANIALLDDKIDGFLLKGYTDIEKIQQTINALEETKDYDISLEYIVDNDYSDSLLQQIDEFVVSKENIDELISKDLSVSISCYYNVLTSEDWQDVSYEYHQDFWQSDYRFSGIFVFDSSE